MDLLWFIVVILIIMWLLGFGAGVGSLIHILLVVAVIVALFHYLPRGGGRPH